MSVHSKYKGVSVISGMNPMDPDRKSVLEEGIKTLLSQHFSHPEKWFVLSELKKYKPSMSVDIYGQKIGRLAEVCEVYCGGEWVCDVSMTDTPSVALLRIKKGLAEVLIRRAEDEVRRKDAELERRKP